MLLTRNTSALAFGAALILFAAACGGGDGATGPGQLADPTATAAKVEALDDAFDSPTLSSFELAVQYSPAAASSLGELRAALRAAQPGPSGVAVVPDARSRRLAQVLRPSLAPRSASEPAAFLPPEVLGKTFEWITTSGTYQITTRIGAPVNGARFILYELGFDGLPVTPLHEIGYADLKDESTLSTDRLHITVVAGSTTYLDYTIGFSFSTSTLSISITGFVTDGARRLDFSMTSSAAETTFSTDITFDVNTENAHVRLQSDGVVFSETSFRFTEDARFQFGSEVLTVTGEVTVEGASVSGSYTINVNGRPFATITFTDSEVHYDYAGSRDLTAEELGAVNAIFSAIGDLILRLVELELVLF